MEISESELKAETGERGHIAYESGLSSSIGTTMHTLRLFGAKVVAVYQNGRMNGEPAVSVNAFGDGYAVLYGSDGNDV
ncbi:MAG TPA: hypothetical protein DDY98_03360, partial [Ruminococcaceae bacterium]|nr:hypothetical protein [Oscillospiraceae bacterium]